MASTPRLSPQDRKDLDKFIKFLVYKSIQVIVQSRLGDRVQTSSKPASSGADWFNLAIKDIPEVLSETKKALSGQRLEPEKHVCLEISLKTAEGDSMVLETWCLSMTEQNDPNVRISYTVYNRMGILLKSLFSVTRVTPAYRLSRKQGPDNYVICYRVYWGDPVYSALGDGYQMIKVGSMATPAGTVKICGAYRVKMLISPHTSCKDLASDLKDDHFKSDTSPKQSTTPKPIHVVSRGSRQSSDDLPGMYSSQDLCATTFSTSPPDLLMASPGNNRTSTQPINIKRKRSFDNARQQQDEFKPKSNPEKELSLSKGQKLGAFCPSRTPEQKSSVEDLPFLTLILHNEGANNNDVTDNQSSGSTKDASEGTDNVMSSTGSNKSNSSQVSGSEDFVMVELKTPFATTDPSNDLGKFYRDCQGAPPLSMFGEQPTVAETLDQITNQLAMFESNMTEFDEFVNSLQATEG